MRITGGILSGRVIKAPGGQNTRPTSDRVREALFNILAHHDWGDEIGDPLTDAKVLDAFCGTGAMAFEALSHGAAQATLFDIDREALKLTRENAAALDVLDRCTISPIDATHPPRATEAYSLIFLDPPYRKNLVPLSLVALQKAGWIAPKGTLIVAETAKNESLICPEGFTVLHARTYGDTTVHFVTTA